MSGCSYDNPCPVCGEQMSCYSDYKPIDFVSGECVECGFYYYTKMHLASKTGLKQMRESWEEGCDRKYKPKGLKIDVKGVAVKFGITRDK